MSDASTVFWADKPNPFEVPTKDDTDPSTDKVRSLLNAVNTGGTVPKDAIY